MAKQIQRRSRAMPKLYDLKKGTNKQTRANWWLLSYANNRQWIYTFVDFCNQIRKKRRKKRKHIDETTTRWNNVPLGWLSFSSTHTYRHAKWHGWRGFVLDGSLFVCDKNCIYFFFLPFNIVYVVFVCLQAVAALAADDGAASLPFWPVAHFVCSKRPVGARKSLCK